MNSCEKEQNIHLNFYSKIDSCFYLLFVKILNHFGFQFAKYMMTE